MAKKVSSARGGKVTDNNRVTTKPRVRAVRMSPEARKTQLLACALRICAEKGIGEAYHSDVAELSGVSVPTTFHYFPSKENMVDSVIEEISRFLIRDVVERHFEDSASAPDIIVSILMDFCDTIDRHPDYIQVWLEWSVATRGRLWASYLEFYKRATGGVEVVLLRGAKEGTIGKKVNVELAARVIVGAAHMIAQMRFAGSSRDDVLETVTSLVDGYITRS